MISCVSRRRLPRKARSLTNQGDYDSACSRVFFCDPITRCLDVPTARAGLNRDCAQIVSHFSQSAVCGNFHSIAGGGAVRIKTSVEAWELKR